MGVPECVSFIDYDWDKEATRDAGGEICSKVAVTFQGLQKPAELPDVLWCCMWFCEIRSRFLEFRFRIVSATLVAILGIRSPSPMAFPAGAFWLHRWWGWWWVLFFANFTFKPSQK